MQVLLGLPEEAITAAMDAWVDSPTSGNGSSAPAEAGVPTPPGNTRPDTGLPSVPK